ncbi:MAG: exodeoxyribonuclease VII large subunit [Bdellovibrionia bacterium]
MKKEPTSTENQLSMLGSSDAKPKNSKTPPPAVRMPSFEPIFAKKKQEALAQLEMMNSKSARPSNSDLDDLGDPLPIPGDTKKPPAQPAAPVPQVKAALPEIVEETEKKDEPNIFSVSEINSAIRGILEGTYSFIWLRGEISNFKAHTSGHHYFSLKDQKAQINAVMFKGFNAKLGFKPHDGMEVIVRGKITVYEPRGTYQIFCEIMEPVGLGALQLAYEQLKKKLDAEGLFDPKRKRPLPGFPTKVAIVTSPTGAAIRDMLNVLGRRFKGLDITLIPVSVQGDKAPGEICAGIELANKVGGFDVMIVGRGGGSIEDLWAFNEEKVCRAIAASKIPTVSAVGHEIDFTLADFVADLRAPTPSAAAELVVKNVADLSSQLTNDRGRLINMIAKTLSRHKDTLRHLEARVIDPQRRIQDAALRCDELVARLENLAGRNIESLRMNIELLTQRLGTPMVRKLEHKKSAWSRASGQLDALSPLRVVERGYALVTSGKKVVTDHHQLKAGDELKLQFAEGFATAVVKEIKDDGIKSLMEKRGIETES